MPTRFGGVGAWRAHRNYAVFLRSRDRGSEDAVVFPGIGDDGYFDQAGGREYAYPRNSAPFIA